MNNNKNIIVYTSGTWDLFHIGHLNILKRSRELGSKLIVGVSTDNLVKSYKNNYPVISFKDRKQIIKNLKFVDRVVTQKKLMDIDLLKKIKPDIITIGDDWKNKYLEGIEWAKNNNIQVIYLPYTQKISSTKIKEDIVLGYHVRHLKDKVAVVTGASSGIGLEIARTLLEEGCKVFIQYFDYTSELHELEYKYCDNIYSVKIDFSSGKTDNLILRALKCFGRVDILINNAGIIDGIDFLKVTDEEYTRLMNINSKVPSLLVRDVFEIMKKQNYGRIINIGSITTKFGTGRNNSIHYAQSKSTLDILSRGISRTGSKYNILINTIKPGVVDTRVQKNRSKKRIDLIPLKRMCKTSEISDLVLFLIIKGNYITGETIVIAGGE